MILILTSILDDSAEVPKVLDITAAGDKWQEWKQTALNIERYNNSACSMYLTSALAHFPKLWSGNDTKYEFKKDCIILTGG